MEDDEKKKETNLHYIEELVFVHAIDDVFVLQSIRLFHSITERREKGYQGKTSRKEGMIPRTAINEGHQGRKEGRKGGKKEVRASRKERSHKGRKEGYQGRSIRMHEITDGKTLERGISCCGRYVLHIPLPTIHS
jgi:hypothetical protein